MTASRVHVGPSQLERVSVLARVQGVPHEDARRPGRPGPALRAETMPLRGRGATKASGEGSELQKRPQIQNETTEQASTLTDHPSGPKDGVHLRRASTRDRSGEIGEVVARI
jgi:hypothetical protein